jgi:hypothetical protein
VIPSAYRPKHDQFLVVDEINQDTGRLWITTNGLAFLSDDPAASGSAAGFVSLGGVEYSRSG